MPASSLLVMSFFILLALQHSFILTCADLCAKVSSCSAKCGQCCSRQCCWMSNHSKFYFCLQRTSKCREASGDGPALPLLLISLANRPLSCFSVLLTGEAEPEDALGNPLLQYGSWCRSLGGWRPRRPSWPPCSWCMDSWTWAAWKLLGIADNEVGLCKPWQSGSCRASSSGGRAGAGSDSWHQQPSSCSCSCSCPWVTAFANLLRVLKLTSQQKAGLGFSTCFAHLPSSCNTFLSFKLLQIINEQ